MELLIGLGIIVGVVILVAVMTRYLNGTLTAKSKTPTEQSVSTIEPSEPWPRTPTWVTNADTIRRVFPSGTEFTYLGKRLCVEFFRKYEYDDDYEIACGYVDDGRLRMWHFYNSSYALLMKIAKEQNLLPQAKEDKVIGEFLDAVDQITKDFTPPGYTKR